MPLYNYNRQANMTPSGRGLNPWTSSVAGMPGGMDFLAGFGPAPKGVTDIQDPAIISRGILGNPQGNSRYDSAASALQRFWPAILKNAQSTIPKWSPQMGGVAANLINSGKVQLPQAPIPAIPQAQQQAQANPWMGLQGAGQMYGMAPQQDPYFGLPPTGTPLGTRRY